MALVIRTLYNNQNWIAPCKQPYQDKLCYVCQRNQAGLNITLPRPGNLICSGSCWEQTLCGQYYWGCTPKGSFWGDGALPGMKVFFVFRQQSNPTLYTLWAKTTVRSKGLQLDTSGQYGKNGYNLVYFNEFKAAPKNNWKGNLTASFIVNAPWGSGNYRYVSNSIEAVLDSLI